MTSHIKILQGEYTIAERDLETLRDVLNWDGRMLPVLADFMQTKVLAVRVYCKPERTSFPACAGVSCAVTYTACDHKTVHAS